ncbi:S-adenosyl-L-methionine-dependent methyltransferase [Hypoxylon sp. FL1284]|nr:S-adenosyl-L-methionine-dependent methyltransferase [Hypoxylon sp. FL1284]
MANSRHDELQKLYGGVSGLNDQGLDEGLEKFISSSEQIMKRPAGLLLAQVGLNESTSRPFTLLDNACGTGPVVAHLQDHIDEELLSKSKIVCADFNENFVDILRRRVAHHGWANIETAVVDAQHSEFSNLSFSHVTINFAMQIVPKPEDVLQDTMRILQPGGVFAMSVWHKDNKGWTTDMRSCFDALPFDAPMPNPLPMATNGKTQWTDPEGIEEELRAHGFENIQVKTEPHITRVQSAEDFLDTYRMMKDWLINTYWSEESKLKAKDMLDEHIVKHLKDRYNGQGWDLSWKAVLATCQKPEEKE